MNSDTQKLVAVSNAHPAPWKAMGDIIVDRNGCLVMQGLDAHIASAVAHTFNDHAVVHYLSQQKLSIDTQ